MVHTIEISKELTFQELEELVSRVKRPEIASYLYLRVPARSMATGINYMAKKVLYPRIYGIDNLTFKRTIDVVNNGDGTIDILNVHYYVTLAINPLNMIKPSNIYRIDLFRCSKKNVRLLSKRFRSVISGLLGYEYNSLSGWKARRVDYTANLGFNTEEEKKAFYKIVHKSSLYSRTSRRYIKDIDLEDQSAAEGNKGYKTLFYDKSEEIEEHFQDGPRKNALLKRSRYTIRMEHQCFYNELNKIRDRHQFKNKSIVRYLKEDIAVEFLTERYRKMVGEGDFYSLDSAVRKIESSSLTKLRKRRVIKFLYEVNENSDTLKEAKHKITSMFSASTFRSRREDLASIGLNPILLDEEAGIEYLEAPSKTIEDPSLIPTCYEYVDGPLKGLRIVYSRHRNLLIYPALVKNTSSTMSGSPSRREGGPVLARVREEGVECSPEEKLIAFLKSVHTSPHREENTGYRLYRHRYHIAC